MAYDLPAADGRPATGPCRLAAVTGVALAAAAALWWLAASRLALERGGDASRPALALLQALALARGLALALWVPRAAIARGTRAAAADALAIAAPAWPLVALAASAATLGAPQVLGVEALLLAACAALPLLGAGLRRALPQAPQADLAAVFIGAALAAALWSVHARWPLLAAPTP